MKPLSVAHIQITHGHQMLILPYHLNKSAHSRIHVLIIVRTVLLNSIKSVAALVLLDSVSFEQTAKVHALTSDLHFCSAFINEAW